MMKFRHREAEIRTSVFSVLVIVWFFYTLYRLVVFNDAKIKWDGSFEWTIIFNTVRANEHLYLPTALSLRIIIITDMPPLDVHHHNHHHHH